MIVKVHSAPNGKMFAICDSELKGKIFEEGEKQLDLSSNFYDGDETSPEELAKIIKDYYIINAVGKESVSFLIGKGFVDKENVMEIAGVPYAQCVVER
jgi:hypothetical protein